MEIYVLQCRYWQRDSIEFNSFTVGLFSNFILVRKWIEENGSDYYTGNYWFCTFAHGVDDPEHLTNCYIFDKKGNILKTQPSKGTNV